MKFRSNVFDTAGNRIGSTIRGVDGTFVAYDACNLPIGDFETAATAVRAVWDRWRYPPNAAHEDELAKIFQAETIGAER